MIIFIIYVCYKIIVILLKRRKERDEHRGEPLFKNFFGERRRKESIKSLLNERRKGGE